MHFHGEHSEGFQALSIALEDDPRGLRTDKDKVQIGKGPVMATWRSTFSVKC